MDALVQNGLLLKQDKSLPSVVGIFTGETVSGSWWSHPRAHEIFAVLNELTDHSDVLVTKLLYRKDTLVHRAGFEKLEMAIDGWGIFTVSIARRMGRESERTR